MSTLSTTTVSVRGRSIVRRMHEVDGVKLVVVGRFLKIASIFDEEWQDAELIADPEAFVARMRVEGVGADILRFTQALPETAPKYRYAVEWTNIAVVDCRNFDVWWKSLRQNPRSDVRKAKKLGLVVEEMPFDDDFARGVKEIYDESPVRQGRKFWHYGKSLEAVKRENHSYLDRSIVIGARWNGELIGFLKIVRVGTGARVMQILSKSAHAGKKTTNAMIAKGVEICAARGLTHLIYGPYTYGENTSVQLTDFKRRNGFVKVDLPRYHVPLNAKGALAIRAGLHLGLKHFVPAWADRQLRAARTAYYDWRFSTQSSKSDAD